MERSAKIHLACLWLLSMAAAAFGQVPQLINYQALLLDPATGQRVADGSYQIVFSIYDVATGGNALWTETQEVQTKHGLYAVMLGSTSPLTSAALSGPEKYLGIKVGAGEEFAPRKRIVSVAYAIVSGNAESLGGQAAADYATKSELATSDGDPPNGGSNLVSWDNLTDVPPGFADQVDDVNGTTGITEIANGNGTLDINNPTGPTTTIDVKDGGISTTQLADGVVTETKLAADAVTGAKILDGSVSAADVGPAIVSSINSVSNDGGNIDLVEGTNVNIQADDGNKTITIHATTGGGDGHSLDAVDGDPVDALLVDNDGKVGIGTTQPEQTLHVTKAEAVGATANTNSIGVFEHNDIGYLSIITPDDKERGILFADPSNASDGGIIYNNLDTPNGLQFRVHGNSPKMVIDSAGRVGIGTTPGVNEKLAISDNGVVILRHRSFGTDGTHGSYYAMERGRGTAANPMPVQDSDRIGGIDFKSLTPSGTFWTSASIRANVDGNLTGSGTQPGNLVFATTSPSGSFSGRMVIKADGNVGIGSTNPSATLDVVGTTELNGNVDINSDLDVDAGTFHVDGVNNRVGIGTTTPDFPLHVAISSTGARDLVKLENTVTQRHIRLRSDNNQDSHITFSGQSGHHAFIGHDAQTGILRFVSTPNLSLTPTALAIQSEGKVGIGTSSPDQTLHVEKGFAGVVTANANSIGVFENKGTGYVSIITPDANERGILFAEPSNAAAGGIIYNSLPDTPDGLQFRVNGNSPKMVIASNGNVGIGTTSPDEQLEITGNFRLPVSTANTGIIMSGGNRFIHSFGDHSNFFAGTFAGNLTMTGLRNTGVGASTLISTTTGSDNTAVGGSALQNNTTGQNNVGIGRSALWNNQVGSSNTANGAYALLNNRGSDNTAIGASALRANFSGSNNTAIGFQADVTASNLTNATAIGANSQVSASNSMVLGGTGANAINVGIGTTTPAGKLHILDDMGRNANEHMLTLGPTNASHLRLGYHQNYSWIQSHGARPLAINPLGNNVGIGRTNPSFPLHMGSGAHVTAGGAWTNASSREYKENIRDLTGEEALTALGQLQPTRFNYKVDKAEEHVGFIAEDVPDLVASTDRKGLSAMDIVAVLTKVVQEQQKRIEQLEARLNDR